jgi:hypothetical protein
LFAIFRYGFWCLKDRAYSFCPWVVGALLALLKGDGGLTGMPALGK